jgi:broad specificity phosphatase PhoE
MAERCGNWVDYRKRLGLSADDEVDLHFGSRDPGVSYYDVMADVERLVEERLRKAQENERPYLMVVHGRSTSRPGQSTARSVVRRFMRSREATPFIVKAHSIQHPTVFIAKIRPRAPTR